MYTLRHLLRLGCYDLVAPNLECLVSFYKRSLFLSYLGSTSTMALHCFPTVLLGHFSASCCPFSPRALLTCVHDLYSGSHWHLSSLPWSSLACFSWGVALLLLCITALAAPSQLFADSSYEASLPCASAVAPCPISEDSMLHASLSCNSVAALWPASGASPQHAPTVALCPVSGASVTRQSVMWLSCGPLPKLWGFSTVCPHCSSPPHLCSL